MPKREGKQLNFNDSFETLEVNFWAAQELLVGLAAARSHVLLSADVSRIMNAQLFAQISAKIAPGPSLMLQKAGEETCCSQAQPSCPSVNAEQFLEVCSH